MRRGNWRVKLALENVDVPLEEVIEEVTEEVVENNDHLLDQENLDEEVDHNHEASDGSDSGDHGNAWVQYSKP